MKSLRIIAAVTAAAVLASCVSPYQAQMGALHQAYTNGQISPDEYNREMGRLQVNDAGWQQANANNVAAGVAIGAVALGTAAILADGHHHHHHHGYYRGGYYRRGYHPR